MPVARDFRKVKRRAVNWCGDSNINVINDGDNNMISSLSVKQPRELAAYATNIVKLGPTLLMDRLRKLVDTIKVAPSRSNDGTQKRIQRDACFFLLLLINATAATSDISYENVKLHLKTVFLELDINAGGASELVNQFVIKINSLAPKMAGFHLSYENNKLNLRTSGSNVDRIHQFNININKINQLLYDASNPNYSNTSTAAPTPSSNNGLSTVDSNSATQQVLNNVTVLAKASVVAPVEEPPYKEFQTSFANTALLNIQGSIPKDEAALKEFVKNEFYKLWLAFYELATSSDFSVENKLSLTNFITKIKFTDGAPMIADELIVQYAQIALIAATHFAKMPRHEWAKFFEFDNIDVQNAPLLTTYVVAFKQVAEIFKSKGAIDTLRNSLTGIIKRLDAFDNLDDLPAIAAAVKPCVDSISKLTDADNIKMQIMSEVYFGEATSSGVVNEIDAETKNVVMADNTTVKPFADVIAERTTPEFNYAWLTSVLNVDEDKRSRNVRKIRNILMKYTTQLSEPNDKPALYRFQKIVNVAIKQTGNHYASQIKRAQYGGKRRTLKKHPKKTAKYQPRVIRKSSRMNKKRSMRR